MTKLKVTLEVEGIKLDTGEPFFSRELTYVEISEIDTEIRELRGYQAVAITTTSQRLAQRIADFVIDADEVTARAVVNSMAGRPVIRLDND